MEAYRRICEALRSGAVRNKLFILIVLDLSSNAGGHLVLPLRVLLRPAAGVYGAFRGLALRSVLCRQRTNCRVHTLLPTGAWSLFVIFVIHTRVRTSR